MSEFPHFQPGQRIGQYEVLRLLGRSMLSEVYHAQDPNNERGLAIKVIRPLLADARSEVETQRRFNENARLVAALNHPNILPLFDYGIERGVYYMVSPVVEGASLRDYLSARRRALPADFALQIFRQMADALAYAHERGMMHQDVRPGNILLEEDNHPYLTDFGLSRIVSGDPLATPIAAMGVPLYMSPEQAAGRPITPSTDIYALGILLYEMYTGDVPFKGDSAASVLVKHLQELPRKPSELNIDIDPRVEQVALRALAKDPNDRFATARDMLEALDKPVNTGEYDTLSLRGEDARSVRAQMRDRTPPADSAAAKAATVERPAVEAASASTNRMLPIVIGVAAVLLVVVLVLILASQGAG